MKIAFDVTCTLGVRTGVGSYAANLTKTMVAQHNNSDFFLYAYARMRNIGLLDDLTSGLPNVRLECWRRSGLGSAIKWGVLHIDPIEKHVGPVDIVHGLFHLIPAARRARRVVTIYDLSMYDYPETGRTLSNYYHRNVVRSSVKKADAMIAISSAVKEELCSRFDVEPSKVAVAYPGVDNDVWRPNGGEEGDDMLCRFGINKPFMVFVGTIQPRKNLGTLIHAYQEARRTLANGVQLVVLGNAGWKYEQEFELLQRAVAENELVHLSGADNITVATIVRHARCLVMPSIYEGFGMPLIEAMASGCPVIASDIPVFKEVCGEAGLYFHARNQEQLSDRICSVFEDDGLAEKLRAKGLVLARKFSWESCAEQVWAHYQKIC